jgi:hypothetical protein
VAELQTLAVHRVVAVAEEGLLVEKELLHQMWVEHPILLQEYWAYLLLLH